MRECRCAVILASADGIRMRGTACSQKEQYNGHVFHGSLPSNGQLSSIVWKRTVVCRLCLSCFGIVSFHVVFSLRGSQHKSEARNAVRT
jgi:hypothetical protein